MNIPINYLAVLVAGITAMVLGGIWYGPMFGKTWVKLIGFTEKDMEKAREQSMAWRYISNFLATLVTAYVFNHFLYYSSSTTIEEGLITALWTWLGFIAAVSLVSVIWEGRAFKLYLINIAYYLVSFMLMAAILVSWK